MRRERKGFNLNFNYLGQQTANNFNFDAIESDYPFVVVEALISYYFQNNASNYWHM